MSTPGHRRTTPGTGRSEGVEGRRRRGHRTGRTGVSVMTVAAVLATGLATGLPAGASTSDADPDLLKPPSVDWEVTPQILEDSVSVFDAADSIHRYSAADSVMSLGDAAAQEEDVIVLQADILFAAMEWDLPDSATARLEDMLGEVPQDASVRVHGHTDSRPIPADHEVDNQGLSENRAQAVADAVAEVRPDLTLDVKGFGDSQPAVAEDPDDPETFAANRRVEIRYD